MNKIDIFTKTYLNIIKEDKDTYKDGDVIDNLNLSIKGQSGDSLICEDPKTGFNVELKIGKNEAGVKINSLFFEISHSKENKEIAISLPEFKKMENVNINGKVIKVNSENKSVLLNCIKINSPTNNEIESFMKLLYDKRRAEMTKKPETYY